MTASPDSPRRRRGARGPAPTASTNLRDVARHAGVSAATASRVFADSPAVRPDTRDRVLAAAAELGYVVNGLAQAMTGRGRRSVAFVAAHMIGAPFAEMAAGAESVATAQGNLLVVTATGDDPAREDDLMRRCASSARPPSCWPARPGRARSSNAGSPDTPWSWTVSEPGLVLCGHPALPRLPAVRTVDYDHVGGVRRAVGHLTAKGHQRIAFLGRQPDRTTPAQRLHGYRQGLRDAGLPPDPALVITCPNRTENAEAAAVDLLGRADRPTAVVALTDVVAVGVYRAARRLGLAIPADVAVAGFDDAPFVMDLTPPLTTVRAPFWEVGVRGTRMALGLETAPGHIQLPTELIVREST